MPEEKFDAVCEAEEILRLMIKMRHFYPLHAAEAESYFCRKSLVENYGHPDDAERKTTVRKRIWGKLLDGKKDQQVTEQNAAPDALRARSSRSGRG